MLPMNEIALSDTDRDRGRRIVLATIDDDGYAVDQVLTEARTDPDVAAGLVTWLAEAVACLGVRTARHVADELRAELITAAARDEDECGESDPWVGGLHLLGYHDERDD
jgi:hypothetical protein